MSILAPTLQAFFTDRLARQRQASPRTVAAYRDTFRLLLAANFPFLDSIRSLLHVRPYTA
jgi:hypothetical protein